MKRTPAQWAHISIVIGRSLLFFGVALAAILLFFGQVILIHTGPPH